MQRSVPAILPGTAWTLPRLPTSISPPRALHEIDDREDYGELREVAIGWCEPRLCFLVFVRRGDDEIRVISFRKATRQEMRRYAES